MGRAYWRAAPNGGTSSVDLRRHPNYLLSFNATDWGWIHLILGVVVGVARIFVRTGNVVARTVGIELAAGQAIVNVVWLPYYPLWAVIVIAVDVLVIWALSTLRLYTSDL